MMYIDDCLRSIIEYMTVPSDQLRLRTYNVAAMSFTPAELHQAVCKLVPGTEIEHQVDSRQGIGKFDF